MLYFALVAILGAVTGVAFFETVEGRTQADRTRRSALFVSAGVLWLGFFVSGAFSFMAIYALTALVGFIFRALFVERDVFSTSREAE